MLKSFVLSSVGAAPVTGVMAQSNVVRARQPILKDIRGATKHPGAMLKGENPFELAKAQTSVCLETYRLKNG